jgi:hypothetical protein
LTSLTTQLMPSLWRRYDGTGYRSENRFTVFQRLEHTIKLPPAQWRVLDQAHRKRSVAEYEGYLDVDQSLVEALIRVAQEVASRVLTLGPPPRVKDEGAK